MSLQEEGWGMGVGRMSLNDYLTQIKSVCVHLGVQSYAEGFCTLIGTHTVGWKSSIAHLFLAMVKKPIMTNSLNLNKKRGTWTDQSNELLKKKGGN